MSASSKEALRRRLRMVRRRYRFVVGGAYDELWRINGRFEERSGPLRAKRSPRTDTSRRLCDIVPRDGGKPRTVHRIGASGATSSPVTGANLAPMHQFGDSSSAMSPATTL